jgi:hypothetical protein
MSYHDAYKLKKIWGIKFNSTLVKLIKILANAFFTPPVSISLHALGHAHEISM